MPEDQRARSFDNLEKPVPEKFCKKCNRMTRMKMNEVWTCPWCDLKKSNKPRRLAAMKDPGHQALIDDLSKSGGISMSADQDQERVVQDQDFINLSVSFKDIHKHSAKEISEILTHNFYSALDNVKFTTIGEAKKVIKLQEKLEKYLAKSSTSTQGED